MWFASIVDITIKAVKDRNVKVQVNDSEVSCKHDTSNDVSKEENLTCGEP